jgi:SH3 domain protein
VNLLTKLRSVPDGQFTDRFAGLVADPQLPGLFFLLQRRPNMPESRPASLALPALRGSLLAALLALAVPAHAEEPASDARWVSDSLSTYVRSGPTDGHRIVGTLKSGQKLTLVGSQGNYSQVRGQNGDLVWILTNDLQSVPGQSERLPQLDAQVAELSGQLKTIDDSWKNRVQGMQETLDSRKKLIDELEARNQALSEQLDQSQSSLRDTQARLGDENKQVMMRYMVYGGSIAGAGLLAGLILPALTRGRKKNDRWF